MSAVDEITKEKQRVSEALARVDAQREKLTGQLSELEKRATSSKCFTTARSTARFHGYWSVAIGDELNGIMAEQRSTVPRKPRNGSAQMRSDAIPITCLRSGSRVRSTSPLSASGI
jgi:hypothetical protein